MRISNFEPQQTKSKGRKLCCSSISSFILCHSVKKLLHLQVGQQYNLIHSIHAVFLPLHMYVCPGKPSLLAPSGVMLRSFQYCSIRAFCFKAFCCYFYTSWLEFEPEALKCSQEVSSNTLMPFQDFIASKSQMKFGPISMFTDSGVS